MSHNVVEHPDFPHHQSILWMAEPTKPLDTALAHLCRFVSEMPVECILYLRPSMGFEALEVLFGFGGENNLVFHSGHNIARILCRVNSLAQCVNPTLRLSCGPRRARFLTANH